MLCIEDVKPEADQQRVPLLQLLMRTTLGEQGFQESWDPGEEANFTVVCGLLTSLSILALQFIPCCVF